MNIKTYQKEAARTTAKLDNEILDTFHYLAGMTTEVGELMDPFKKQLAYNKKIDLPNVKEEVGDLMWYVANFCNLFGFDLEEILESNIEKLKIRYPEKFSEDRAINRDLIKEREVLEKK